jgi:PAS domain S-box-containing protein
VVVSQTTLFDAIFAALPFPALVFDRTGRTLAFNQAACDATGLSAEELRASDDRRLMGRVDWRRADGRPMPLEEWPWRQADPLREPWTCHLVITRPDGRASRIEVTVMAINIPLLDRNLMVSTAQDVTDHVRAEAEILRTNRLYAALSHVNQAIARVQSRDGLFAEVTRALVEFGGFQMVWIGWLAQSSRELKVVSQRGDDSGYLEGIRVSADERPEGQGPVGMAIRDNRPCICNDFLSDPRMAPWRSRAAQAAWRGGGRARAGAGRAAQVGAYGRRNTAGRRGRRGDSEDHWQDPVQAGLHGLRGKLAGRGDRYGRGTRRPDSPARVGRHHARDEWEGAGRPARRPYISLSLRSARRSRLSGARAGRAPNDWRNARSSSRRSISSGVGGGVRSS